MAEFDETLMSLVKDYPCLYNIKSSHFKVNIKKENAWKEIGLKMECSGKQKLCYIQYTIQGNHYIFDLFQLILYQKGAKCFVKDIPRSIKKEANWHRRR